MIETLAQFLAAPQRPDGTLKLHEVQGLLFAVACSPELIRPSEWMPLIFNDGDVGYADMEEAEAVLEALVTLYNEINIQVLEGEVALPENIRLELPALENVGEASALGQWSRGFSLGHDWLMELWNQYTPNALDEELGSSLMVLSFFSSRELAEAFYHEATKMSSSSLEEFAETMLSLIEDAMNSYAHLARSIQTVLAEREQPKHSHAGGVKVGRNDPCPCGSGKKYKKCCLQRLT